ncbi:hypothetical protein [Neokomagataea thailandica]|uniref:Phage protein n=1 Tax=Neokomagataea tanensis NBRC 106556 TaxID=1223519 RepID=A0ABQ0QGS1_9PROT|nr:MULTISPECIES: hypothetical protein [Neokomagataea]GBR44209.1 hypothetical protein AA106556_0348 [Neokomagataea tanensis NBRC 106556]
MAGLSQVGQALAYQCAQLIYPQGLHAESVTGRQVIIRRGWLLPNDIFAVQGIRNNVDYLTITMVPHNTQSNMPILPEPLGRPWRVRQRVAATVDAVSLGDGRVRLVFPSVGAATGVVGIWTEDGRSAARAVMAGDTPVSVAQALATQLDGVLAEDATLSVPGCSVFARVGGYGESVRTVRRQMQRYRLSIWTADASAREIIGGVVDTALADMSWLSFIDGGQGHIHFAGVEDVDTMQNETLFRRDYFYDIQFDVEQVQWSSELMFGGGQFDHGHADMWGVQVPQCNAGVVEQALQAMKNAEMQQVGQGVYPGMAVDAFGTVSAVNG